MPLHNSKSLLKVFTHTEVKDSVVANKTAIKITYISEMATSRLSYTGC